MKNLIKLIGVFILITLTALTLTSCPEPVDSEGFMAGGGGGAPGGGTPGGGIDPHTHNWSSWTQTKAPTETQDGSETRTCSNNPVHSETRSIAALNHTHNWGAWTVTTPATCTAAGEEKRTCTLNATHYETQISGSPLGHDYEWKQTTASTFIQAGVETNVCNHDSSHTNGTRVSPQLEIKTTNDWNTARSQLNGKSGNYTLTINGDFGVVGTTVIGSNTDYFGVASGSSVTLKGSGKINLTSNGCLLYVVENRTLVIDSVSLTFEGLPTYDGSLVNVQGGTLELKNGTITGGAVDVNNSGTFNMTGGTISGNTASVGGGVFVSSLGTFNMNGGTISGNTANNYAGGVYVGYSGIFNMNGGTISGNTAKSGSGGGVNVDYGTFRIVNGTIFGSNEPNTALRNTATTNAALSVFSSTVEYGTFNGTTWNSKGSLSSTDNTIKVVNGVPQP